jgi:subtilisin family serine protease
MATRATKAAPEELTSEVIDDLTPMDPRLQRLIVKRRSGERTPATASTDADEVAVIAKVSDLQRWQELSEVRVGDTIGGQDPDGTWIVTGRIPVTRIEYVRTQPWVKSLKAAQRTRPTLNATLPDIHARPADLPASAKADGGKGVVVGVVDYGCAFAHENFLTSTGKTRLLALWDQTGSAANAPLGYGTLHLPDRINAALKTTKPYRSLGHSPGDDEAAHGTHVLDIAAGNGRGTGNPGVAPRADLIFVEVSSSDVPDEGERVVGTTFGDSVQVVEAVKFIFDQAGSRPAVVNLSLGTNGGPHDGTTLVEQAFDRLLREKPNRAIVLAASNSYADEIHAAGTVPSNGTSDIRWRVSSSDQTENELEIWFPGGRMLTADVIAPGGRTLASIAAGQSFRSIDGRGRVVMVATNRQRDPSNGDNVINIWQAPGAPSGEWTIRLRAEASPVPFHAWVERDDYRGDVMQSKLDSNDATTTLGTLSCGHLTLVVGSYDARKAAGPLSWFSSSGPTRDGRQKPELSAPGHGVRAANSLTRGGIAVMSGTSMASPAVAGAAALLLGSAVRRGKTLTTEALRKILIDTARPVGAGWDARYGYGRVDVSAALAKLGQGASPVARRLAKPAPARDGALMAQSAKRRKRAAERPGADLR